MSVTEAGNAPPKKKRFIGWAKLAKELAKAPGIDEMRATVDEHRPLLPHMPPVEKYIQTALNWDTRDELAVSLMPLTKSAFRDRFVPVWTSGNGNCFFNALSRVAYGHEGHSSDLRTRCILEALQNEDNYVLGVSIAEGSGLSTADVLHFVATQSSAMDDEEGGDYTAAFHAEIKKMATPGTEVGLWTFLVAANVMACPVESWFPFVHNSADIQIIMLRKHCHRFFYPREEHMKTCQAVTIMWTMSHADANQYDHFIPIVK